MRFFLRNEIVIAKATEENPLTQPPKKLWSTNKENKQKQTLITVAIIENVSMYFSSKIRGVKFGRSALIVFFIIVASKQFK